MELLATFLLGLVAGLVLAWVNGALGEHGRQWAVARIERRRAAQQEREAEEAAVAARDAAQEQTERKVETLERLRREREGRCFVWRADADDVGMRGIVEELDARQPARRVIVRWKNPDSRQPTEHDFIDDERVSMEWKSLVLSPAQQRHRTARLIAESSDDADGWVEFQEVPNTERGWDAP